MKHTLLILFGIFILSCNDTKEEAKITQEEAVAISKQDTLSEADVLKMMNAEDVATKSYSGAITFSVAKEYFFQSDTNKNNKFILKTENPNIGLFLYKEVIKKVKVDSATTAKVKDYTLIKDSTMSTDFSKKATNYKMVVKFIHKEETNDSTAMFSLDIISH